MAFSNLTIKDVSPVKESIKEEQVFNCTNFTGKLSFTTGINSKFLYIGRLKETINSVISLNPTVRIVCTPECTDRCMNLKMYNRGDDILVSYKELSKDKIELPQVYHKGWVRKPDTNELQNIDQNDEVL